MERFAIIQNAYTRSFYKMIIKIYEKNLNYTQKKHKKLRKLLFPFPNFSPIKTIWVVFIFYKFGAYATRGLFIDINYLKCLLNLSKCRKLQEVHSKFIIITYLTRCCGKSSVKCEIIKMHTF